MSKGRAIPYSPAEMTWLEFNKLMPIGEYHRSFCEEFAREDVKLVHLHSLRKRKGWLTGRTGRFERGLIPQNKGKKMPYNAGSAATRFKKGNMSGRAAAQYKPIGTERLSKEGYLERKIHDGLPLQSRWRAVHRIRWEQLHGPVPKGHALKCLNSDRLNTDPTNWRAVPRAILPRLAGGRMGTKLAYDRAPDELRPTIIAVAELENRARTARRGKEPR